MEVFVVILLLGVVLLMCSGDEELRRSNDEWEAYWAQRKRDGDA